MRVLHRHGKSHARDGLSRNTTRRSRGMHCWTTLLKSHSIKPGELKGGFADHRDLVSRLGRTSVEPTIRECLSLLARCQTGICCGKCRMVFLQREVIKSEISIFVKLPTKNQPRSETTREACLAKLTEVPGPIREFGISFAC
jgi:hypothetical protein